MASISKDVRVFLDKKVAEFNRPAFILNDPVSIPHEYTRQQDIEIAGFFAAIFAWGNRATIIKKTQELMELMDRAPYQFVLHHTDNDLKRLLGFRHRTFNATDLLYFVAFFQHHYRQYTSLEEAFLRPWEISGAQSAPGAAAGGWQAERALSAFYHYFFSLDGDFSSDPKVPPRTRKHIASPEKHSSCKRINMFLRWMVRADHCGVDFGLWRRIPMARLICPLDLHVARVAKKLGLLNRKLSDWQAASELTDQLLLLDPADPVKYDFALFGLGVMEKF
ncbi:MAG TPA: TIGR02757 family protein [Puia sp.]|nr:TIGR02757 family protein [Puia sp.]